MTTPPGRKDAPGTAADMKVIQSNLRQAFPLPSSGRFDDLLELLSQTEGKAAERK